VILAYLFVSALHGLWDGLPDTFFFVVPPGISLSITTLLLGVIGLVTLAILYRGAMIRQMHRPAATYP
jgi:hypothetical protein